MSRSSQLKKANRSYGIGTGIVLGSVALLSLLVWAFRPPTLDPETLCPIDRPVAGHTLVIVDRTDRWNPGVGSVLTELLEDARNGTQKLEKFSIVSLDSTQATRPLFSVCNPGKPTFLTDLYRGRRYTERDFDQRFETAAEDVIQQVSQPGEAQKSPIVETVRRAMRRADFNASIPQRRLVLISDMRQNSDQMNIYSDHDRASALSALVQRELGEEAKDVAFDVYFVAHGHDYNVSEADVRDAWASAFQTINAHYQWRRLD
jgi:hypothetical protein